jgi:putative peptidoglycan lipid II flippase
MIRSFLTVSTGTLASRLLGFVRDSALAALLGAGGVADAFLAAFQLVNVVRRLLTEGGLNAALVPAWLRVLETEGAVAAAAFAGPRARHGDISVDRSHSGARAGDAARHAALAPGFSGRETLQLATDNARLMLPYLAFAGPVTVMMALLNAQGRFALTAFSPLLFNIALIAVMVALLAIRPDAVQAAQIIAATVGFAGLLQLSVLVLRRGGNIAGPLRISFDPEIRGFLAKAAPGMMASSAPQLLMVAGAIIASSSPVGGVVALFRGPAGRTAARHRRRRHGHRADPGIIARGTGRGSRRRCTRGIARPRTRGRAGAAGNARPDRAERADRAAAVRARRLHR